MRGPTVESIAWSSDGTRLALASSDIPVKIWNTSSSLCEMLLGGYGPQIQSVVWSSGGARLASAHGGDITIWTTSASQDDAFEIQINYALDQCLGQLTNRDTLQPNEIEVVGHNRPAEGSCYALSPIRSITWSNKGTQLATSSGDNTVEIWDTTTGQCKAEIKSPGNLVTPFAWSSDGIHLTLCSDDGHIKMWNLNTGWCKETVLNQDHDIWTVAWSDDGRRLASGNSWDVKIWDMSTGKCKKLLDSGFCTTQLSWSGDNTQLASGFSNIIRVWDSRTGKCKLILEHEGLIKALAWSSDDTRLASACHGEIKIWNLSTGWCEQTFGPIFDPVSSGFLHFDDDVPQHLHTPAGTVDLASFVISGEQHSSPPSFKGIGLNDDGSWITYDGRHILWLPPEYRPNELAISGERIAIGCESGRVLIVEVAKDLIPI